MTTVRPDSHAPFERPVAPAVPGPPPGVRDDEIPLSAVLAALRRHRALVVALPLAFAVAVGVYALTRAREWVAAASFVPASNGDASAARIAGLAAQFGVAVPGNDTRQSPAFYADLVTTRRILGPVVDATYVRPGTPGAQATLIEILGVEAATPALRRDRAIARLADGMSVTTGRQTGVVSFSVTAPTPQLAAAVAERILAEVNAFNMESRRRQAQLERRFVEERLAEARAALRVAEDRLLTWAATNRVIGSPRLLLEQQRLEREVAQAEGLYTSLEQGFAQARLSELRNMPAVVTVEEPEVPARPAPRFVVQKVAAATVAGLALALAIAFVRAFVFAPAPGRAAVAAVSARDER